MKEESFEMTNELKKLLHTIEERHEAPKELLNLYGTEWIIAILNYLLEDNKNKVEIIQDIYINNIELLLILKLMLKKDGQWECMNQTLIVISFQMF